MSLSSQATSQRLPFSYDDVFNGLVVVIPEGRMNIKSQDKVIGRITASTDLSLMSWGENLTIIVERIDEHSTNIGIESSLRMGANLAGSHRHQKNFNEIISALSQWLQKNKNYTPSDKKCPYCAEVIKAEAKICRFCNRDVPAYRKPVETTASELENIATPGLSTGSKIIKACFIVAAILCVVFFVFNNFIFTR